MPLTTANYISLMEHALGKTPDARHSLLATFNRAGRALTNKHPWYWRVKENTALAAVANVDYFALPDDFGELRTAYIDAATSTGDYSAIRLASMEEIAQWRQAYDAQAFGPSAMAIAFPEYTSSATDTTQPTFRAPCFPTPTTNGDPTLTLNYLCVWRECDASSNEVPNIPPEFEEALRLYANHAALTTENPSGDYSNIKALRDEAVSELLIADARRQPDGGRLTGGANSRSANQGMRHILAMPINL